MIKHIGIIGTGGIGGYFGGKLCWSAGPGKRVYFLARKAHLEAIRQNGLTVKTAREGTFSCRPALASDDPSQFPVLDLVLVTVKGYDLERAMKALSERVTAQTILVPLLNGLDIAARIREILPEPVILPACTYISSHIEAPGIVAQTGGACLILFGRDPARPGISTEGIHQVFTVAGIPHEEVQEPEVKIWEKFIFIAPFSLVTARYGKTLGEVIDSPEESRAVRAIMREIVALAERKGIPLPEGIIETTLEKARGFPPESRTSFQKDFANPGKRDERAIFGGALLRLCDTEGVDCPVTRNLYRTLNRLKPFPI